MLNTFGVHIKRIFQRFSNNINSMPQVNTEKHTRISKTKVKKFETAESLFPTVSFQVGSSPAPLTVNRGRGQRIGRVPSWQEIYLFADSSLLMSSRFQCFSRYRLLLLAPFLRRRGSFCSQPAAMRSWMARLTVASDRPVSRETVGMNGKQVPSLLLRSRR